MPDDSPDTLLDATGELMLSLLRGDSTSTPDAGRRPTDRRAAGDDRTPGPADGTPNASALLARHGMLGAGDRDAVEAALSAGLSARGHTDTTVAGVRDGTATLAAGPASAALLRYEAAALLDEANVLLTLSGRDPLARIQVTVRRRTAGSG